MATKSKAKNRPTRASVVRRNILTAIERPGYVRRWVNEEPGAIESYEEIGYRPVVGDGDGSDKRAQTEAKVGSVVRRVVNRRYNASSKHAILMEIPEDLYHERQKLKSQELDEAEKSWNPRFSQVAGTDFGFVSQD